MLNIRYNRKFILLIFLIFALSSTLIFKMKSNKKNATVRHTIFDVLKLNLKYPGNNYYVTNNNIAQYSSYIIIDNDNTDTEYRVEVIIEYNVKYIKDFGIDNNFVCILKYYISKSKVEIIELHPVDSVKINVWENRKFIFNLKLEQFQIFKKNSNDFDLNKIVIAVIWANDFNRYLDSVSFISSRPDTKNKNRTVKFPYSFITFQKPDILKTEPRLPSLSICAANFYGNTPPEFHNWIHLHLQFGVEHILIYDGNLEINWNEKIRENYRNDDRIKVLDDQSLFADQCNDNILYKQFSKYNLKSEIVNYLKKNCYEFFDFSHRSGPKKSTEIGWTPNVHRIVVLNDCFTRLSKKYEFILIHDFDEFVYPRNMDTLEDFYNQKRLLSCNNLDEICSSVPLVYKKDNNLYNYLQSLIKKYGNRRSIKNLASIEFKQAETMPREYEKKFIHELGSLINHLNASTVFPMLIPANKHHIFIIEKEDTDYIKYIHNAYNSLIKCFYEGYFQQIDALDKQFIRALYFFPSAGRFPKTVHYYKNVRSVNIHWVEERTPHSWMIFPSEMNGHFSEHYRGEIEIYDENNPIFKQQYFNQSIKKLNIDFEFLLFIFKKYATGCSF